MKICVKAFALCSLALGTFWSPAIFAQDESAPAPDIGEIVANYADIGLASYQGSLELAKDLRVAIEDLLNNPNPETLDEARTAWRTARIPYEQSEVFVYALPVVQNWVSRVNAWPINESFLDYVETGYYDNIINARSLSVNGTVVEIEKITPEIIANSLHQIGGDTANVASGYHVIEFLLWGEDNSGPEEKDAEAGAGLRPASDFDLENCTHDNCARRGEYLYSVVNLLVDDLEEMVSNWQVTGEARRTLLADPKASLGMMLNGLGSLSYGELAGRRLQAPLILQTPDSEPDQFSNNSHLSYLLNMRGLVIVYFGEYYTMQGELIAGPSLADLVKDVAPELDEKFRFGLGLTLARMRLMVDHARDVEAFDLMIAQGNETGNSLVSAVVQSLVAQSELLEKMVLVLDLPEASFLGSIALDNPGSLN